MTKKKAKQFMTILGDHEAAHFETQVLAVMQFFYENKAHFVNKTATWQWLVHELFLRSWTSRPLFREIINLTVDTFRISRDLLLVFRVYMSLINIGNIVIRGGPSWGRRKNHSTFGSTLLLQHICQHSESALIKTKLLCKLNAKNKIKIQKVDSRQSTLDPRHVGQKSDLLQ